MYWKNVLKVAGIITKYRVVLKVWLVLKERKYVLKVREHRNVLKECLRVKIYVLKEYL